MTNSSSTLPSSTLRPPIATDVPSIAKDGGFRQALCRLIDTHLLYAKTPEDDPRLDAHQAAASAAWNAVCAVADAFLLSHAVHADASLAAEPLAAPFLAPEPLAPEPLAPALPQEQKAEEQKAEEQRATQRAAQEQEDADFHRMRDFLARLYPLARRQFKIERSWNNPWYKQKGVNKQQQAWEELIEHLLSLRDEEGDNLTWIDRFEGVHWQEKAQRKKEKKQCKSCQ